MKITDWILIENENLEDLKKEIKRRASMKYIGIEECKSSRTTKVFIEYSCLSDVFHLGVFFSYDKKQLDKESK
jgi:hypothetical protein